MGAEQRRVVFRYALGEAVYLEGSRTAYTVQAYTYTAWTPTAPADALGAPPHEQSPTGNPPRREHRQYLLQPSTGGAFWIHEALIQAKALRVDYPHHPSDPE